MKILMDLRREETRGTRIDKITHFEEVMLFAQRGGWIGNGGRNLFKVHLHFFEKLLQRPWGVVQRRGPFDESHCVEDLPNCACGPGKPEVTALQTFISGQILQESLWTRSPVQVFRRRKTHFDDGLDHFLAETNWMAMSSTRTRKQDGRITRIGVSQSFLPFTHHTFRAPDRIGKLLHRPVRMLVQQGTQVGAFAHPINFHTTLLLWDQKDVHGFSVSQRRKSGKSCFCDFISYEKHSNRRLLVYLLHCTNLLDKRLPTRLICVPNVHASN